ncbi:hypothetical protein [Curtobacterium sp. ISL-83]|uniref:hypothetical protein n=1 Tax=Curtobacterium sp. ISL-83 TaxID=2819145 RepID=UPI001BE624DA|nr:hypothetical protein [Curtobacterium sp. ISL-83]MBT2503886.1 hypothetical protein [Curtobacterium sp. ISL-83]
MSEGMITVQFKLNPVNGWFIRALADPFVSIDGDEQKATWSSGATIRVPAGVHRVVAFFRYRGTSSALASASLDVDVAGQEQQRITARNGVMNQTPFRLTAL